MQPSEGTSWTSYVEGDVRHVSGLNITSVVCYAGSQGVQVPDATVGGWQLSNFYVLEDIENPGYGSAQYVITNVGTTAAIAPVAIELTLDQSQNVTLDIPQGYADGSSLGQLEVTMETSQIETDYFFSGADLTITNISVNEQWTGEIDFQDTETSGDITVSAIVIHRDSPVDEDCTVVCEVENADTSDASVTVTIEFAVGEATATATLTGEALASTSTSFETTIEGECQTIFDTYDADSTAVTITSITIS